MFDSNAQIQIHNLRKILIILINESSDSNYSLKFTIFVVVPFTKEEKRQRQQTKQKIVILVNVESWRVETNNKLN